MNKPPEIEKAPACRPTPEMNPTIEASLVKIAPHVGGLISLLGQDVLLLSWPAGVKGLKRKWGHLSVKRDMADPRYLATLATGNIGIAQGDKSGGLISIDVDSDEAFAEFVELNIDISDTLQSKGRRGGNMWFRMQGPYPKNKTLTRLGKKYGEWRATGNQTIIYGTHPDGGEYSHNNKPPRAISYEQIKWPAGVTPPIISYSENDATLQRSADCGIKPLNSSASPLSSSAPPLLSSVNSLEDVIRLSLPDGPKQNHWRLFRMARGKLTLEEKWGRKLTNEERKHLFDEWFKRAEATGFLTDDYDHYKLEFGDAARNAKHPFKESAMLNEALERTKNEPFPPEAIEHFKSNNARLVVAFVKNIDTIARKIGVNPWFISSHKAGEKLGLSHTFIWKCLMCMVDDGILRIIKPGNEKNATRYEYIWGQEQAVAA